MSNYATSWAWRLQVKGLTAGAKAVLVRLADSANDNFECWPSQTVIARDTLISRRSVIFHLEQLESLGLLTRKYILKANGARRGTLYKLNAGEKFATIVVPTVDLGEDTDDVIGNNLGADPAPRFDEQLEGSEDLSAIPALRDLPVDNSKTLSAIPAHRVQNAHQESENLSADFAPRPESVVLGAEIPGAGIALRDLPVDNSKNLSAEIAHRHQTDSKNKVSLSADSAGLSAESALTLRKKPNLTPKLKDSSSSMSNFEPDGSPPGDEEDDDSVIVDRDLANVLRGLHSRLDATVLVDRLQRSGLVEVAALDLGLAAVEIIGGSARAVGDPVAYVSKAILAEPWRWAREPGNASGSGAGSRPPTLSECASQGHKWVGPWRETCAGCGAERSGWRDDRDRDGIEVAS